MKKLIPSVIAFIFLAGVSVSFVQAQGTQRITYQCSLDGVSYNSIDACEASCARSEACNPISAPSTPITPTTPTPTPTPAPTTHAPIVVSAGIPNPFSTGGNIIQLFQAILHNVVEPIGAVAAVLAFVYSGFLYVKAQGNESELKTAHQALLYTVIGTAILIGATVIAEVIGNTINQLR